MGFPRRDFQLAWYFLKSKETKCGQNKTEYHADEDTDQNHDQNAKEAIEHPCAKSNFFHNHKMFVPKIRNKYLKIKQFKRYFNVLSSLIVIYGPTTQKFDKRYRKADMHGTMKKRKALCAQRQAKSKDIYLFLIVFHNFPTVFIKIKERNPTKSPTINSRITDGKDGSR